MRAHFGDLGTPQPRLGVEIVELCVRPSSATLLARERQVLSVALGLAGRQTAWTSADNEHAARNERPWQLFVDDHR